MGGGDKVLKVKKDFSLCHHRLIQLLQLSTVSKTMSFK